MSLTRRLLLKIINIEEIEEEEENRKRWTDAPEEILLLIKSRLNFVDQLQFGAVCRAWNSLPKISCIGKLPWMLGMRCDPYGSLRACALYDPSSEKNYSFDHEVIMPHGDKEPPYVNVFCSKQGWVSLRVMPRDTDECKVLLFNAFTLETIHLPVLKIEGISHYNTVMGTFSTLPTSSDFIFYLILFNRKDAEIGLFTYSYGKERWNTFKLSIGKRVSYIPDVICMNNILYFTSGRGKIWAFDIANEGDWAQIPIDRSAVDRDDNFRIFKLVEYNNDMLLVGYVFRRWRTYDVYKMDWSRKAWVEQVTELSNVALFMSDAVMSHAVSVTSDYDDQKLNLLHQQIYGNGDANDYRGHARDFYLQTYFKGTTEGMESLLPECVHYMAWVSPH